MAIIEGKIRCPECSEWKVLDHFQRRDQERGNGYCRPCRDIRKRRWMQANRQRDSDRRRELYAAKKSPEAHAELLRRRELAADERRRGRRAATVRYRLKSRYSISEDEYARLIAAQGDRCAVCGIAENIDSRLWCVDHDHESGRVRGLLCVRCNAGIGALGDTIEGLRRAINYLERAQQQPPVRITPSMRVNLLQGAN